MPLDSHHSHGEDRTLAERNKEHFDSAAPTIFQSPWIAQMSDQIFNELRDYIDWIGFNKDGSQSAAGSTKMLDYACGDGLASRALAPFLAQIRGLDISSGMVEQYNIRASKEGFSTDKMHAIHGDLVDVTSTPCPELDTPEYSNFNLVIMSMALHHVENPPAMIQKLSERLCPGGVLLIVDWVSQEESGCPLPNWDKSAAGHTVSRMGFVEAEVKGFYEKAGLESWGWKWFSKQSDMPEEFGGKQQLFLARGEKK